MKHSRCPYDCPTPYPHSLTSISLLVSPRQIRKASQHLHGDRPQSSRWPQCAARQLKRKRRAGKWKWVRTGEGGGGCSCLCLKPAHKRTHLWHLAVHASTHVHASPHPPLEKNKTKNKYPPPAPITKHQRGENEKRGWGRQEKCGAQQTAPLNGAQPVRALARSQASFNSSDKSRNPINGINPPNPI